LFVIILITKENKPWFCFERFHGSHFRRCSKKHVNLKSSKLMWN